MQRRGGTSGSGGAGDASTDACADGGCTPTCSDVTTLSANVGCEFWAVDLDQQDGGGNDPASEPWGVVITNPGATDAQLTIEINTAGVGQAVATSVVTQATVSKGGVKQIALPTRELDCGTKPNDYASPGTCLSSKAVRITSTEPVAVYQFNGIADTFSNDASLLLPTHALGKVHRVVGWSAGHPKPLSFPSIGTIVDRAYVTVVGVKAATQVKVSPSWRIRGNPPIAATPAGGQVAVTLGPFDVLNLETDDATDADAPATVADLSGTLVESDQPVAVFSGVESGQVPGALTVPTPPGWTASNTCCLDHLEEQVVPVASLGSDYVVARSPIRSSGGFAEPDVVRIVGGTAVAAVKTSLPAPFDSFTLQPGEVKTTWTQGNFTLSATQPVLVAQLLVSRQFVAGTPVGDPSLVLLPAIQKHLTEYLIPTSSAWTANWIVIAAPSGTKLTFDGAPPSGCSVEPAGTLGGKAYESVRCAVGSGVHRLKGDQPFGVTVYGYGTSSSYAFVGGAAR